MSEDYKIKPVETKIKPTLPQEKKETDTENYTVLAIDEEGIFSKTNKLTDQYGGNQMDFENNVKELLKDPIIIAKIREYFPDATLEDCELYLRSLTYVGCGYVAAVNTIFKAYQGREEEFAKTFGFPMYKISDYDNEHKYQLLDYNYEYLILDFFNYDNTHVWNNYTQQTEYKKKDIKDLYDGITKSKLLNILYLGTGIKETNVDGTNGNTFPYFLEEKYGVKVDLEDHSNYPLERVLLEPNTPEYDEVFNKRAKAYAEQLGSAYEKLYIEQMYGKEQLYADREKINSENVIDAYKELSAQGRQVVLSAKGYTMWNKNNPLYFQISTKNTPAGHAMYVTGVTNDGKKLIVSSWGEEWVLDLSSVEKREGYIVLYSVAYE